MFSKTIFRNCIRKYLQIQIKMREKIIFTDALYVAIFAIFIADLIAVWGERMRYYCSKISGFWYFFFCWHFFFKTHTSFWKLKFVFSFDSTWIDWQLDDKKSLIIIQQRCQREIFFTAGPFVMCNEFLVKVMFNKIHI